MKSVKPGRGSSFMGGLASIFGIIFGIFWTIMAISIGAPFFFPLFGLLFIGIGVANAVYSFKNATGEQRYSEFDIVDSNEEPDPWNQRFRAQSEAPSASKEFNEGFAYCPYCGAKLGDGFAFCGKCGKPLPKQEDTI